MKSTRQSNPRAVGFECLTAMSSALVVSLLGASKCDAPLGLWEFLMGAAALPVGVWGFLRCPPRPVLLKAAVSALLMLSAWVAWVATRGYFAPEFRGFVP